MAGTPRPGTVSTKRMRIAALAKQMPGTALRSLSHHMDLDWLREAYRRTRKDGASGVDGQTAAEYAENLEENLQSLLNRAKSGTYRAPPVRRVHIPKGDGTKTRPLGIPTFEDKVLQRAVGDALGADFTSRTSTTSRTASVHIGPPMMRWMLSIRTSIAWEGDGFWMRIFGATSITSGTKSFGTCCANG